MADMDGPGNFDPSNPSHRPRLMNYFNGLGMHFTASENQQYFLTNSSVQSILEEHEMHLPASQHTSIGANRGFNFSGREPSLSTDGNSLRGSLCQRVARAGFRAPTINTGQIYSADMAFTFFDSPRLIPNASVSSPTDNNKGCIQNDSNEPSCIKDPVNDISQNSSHPETEFDGENDGFKWRKYGQKPVKGCEFPRSYYKCTHPSCHVNKKVERCPEGYITRIIYKGTHNHETPVKKCRSGIPPYQRCYDKIDASTMHGESSSAEFGEDSNYVLNQDAVNISSSISDDELEDGETHTSIGNEGDGEGDDNDSNRRSLDACAGANRAREPRVVVQTESKVDILDDGYRWRKYGQKVVKGNPNPRSYYKCTSAGCRVRKHIERASNDLTSVITTYEGKHNHEVPPARSSVDHSTAYQSHAPNRRFPQLHQNSLMNTDPPSFLNNLNLPNLDYGVGPVHHFDVNSIRIGLRSGSMGMGQMGYQVRYPVLDSSIGAYGLVLPKEEDQTTVEPYDQHMTAPLGPLGPPM